MTTIERLTDLNDAPVYTVRDNSAALRGQIRHRWGLWTYEPTPHEIRAADADLDRLTARLPRILEDTTMSDIEIDLAWTLDPYGLFASEADMVGADVQASMAEYDSLLLAAVRAAFPDAIVEHADRGRIWDNSTDGNGANTEAAHNAGLVVQQIADDVLASGDWIVRTDAS